MLSALAFVQGLGAGAALIVAIGAQNAFVLRHGIRGEHVTAVVLVSAVCDAILITLGGIGVGAALQAQPSVMLGARWGGAALLLLYGLSAARRAFGTRSLVVREQASLGVWPTIAASIGFSFLNPHCWLDTVVLLGTMNSQQAPGSHVAFALGAISASFAWFFALGFGARLLAPHCLPSRPAAASRRSRRP